MILLVSLLVIIGLLAYALYKVKFVFHEWNSTPSPVRGDPSGEFSDYACVMSRSRKTSPGGVFYFFSKAAHS